MRRFDAAQVQKLEKRGDDRLYYVSVPPVEADIWLIELPDDPQEAESVLRLRDSKGPNSGDWSISPSHAA